MNHRSSRFRVAAITFRLQPCKTPKRCLLPVIARDEACDDSLGKTGHNFIEATVCRNGLAGRFRFLAMRQRVFPKFGQWELHRGAPALRVDKTSYGKR
jgi:hypothetical protein